MLNGNFSEDSTVIYVRVQHSVHTLRDNIQTLISIIRCVLVVLVSDLLVVLRHSSANDGSGPQTVDQKLILHLMESKILRAVCSFLKSGW